MSDGSKIEAKRRKSEYDRARYARLRAERRRERPPDIIETLDDLDIAYIAGLIDGEGSIYAHRHKDTCYPAISIIMTHEGVMTWLADALGVTVVPTPARKPGWAPQFFVRLHGSRAVLLCRRMLPFLRVKKEQAALLCEFPPDQRVAPTVRLSGSINAQRHAIRERLSELNARGPKDAN